MLASGSKIRRQMKENVRHRRLNPRKRALVWGLTFRKELRKKPFKRRKSEGFFEKPQTPRKLSLFYGLPMKKKLRKVKPLLSTIKRNISFLPLLERRLDVIPVRISFRKHILQARQPVRHKHIYVNSGIVNLPGFLVSRGDPISIREASKDIIRSNITEYRERTKRIGRSVRQLKKGVKRTFLRPLFYPFLRGISIPRSSDPFLEKFSPFIQKRIGERRGNYEGRLKRNVLFHYPDFYHPHYLEVEYGKPNVVVFAEPPYRYIKFPYRDIEKTHSIQ
uniref:Ribosomal protein S4 n=1 Tax=Psilotum nudum TaxID=3240 RepID=A0A1B3TRK5_PSINU|nr:ribosomal protein S4 [Psilotum nudum]AOH05919.1 ribosomal protein S4 [Psilotum nudum]